MSDHSDNPQGDVPLSEAELRELLPGVDIPALEALLRLCTGAERAHLLQSLRRAPPTALHGTDLTGPRATATRLHFDDPERQGMLDAILARMHMRRSSEKDEQLPAVWAYAEQPFTLAVLPRQSGAVRTIRRPQGAGGDIVAIPNTSDAIALALSAVHALMVSRQDASGDSAVIMPAVGAPPDSPPRIPERIRKNLAACLAAAQTAPVGEVPGIGPARSVEAFLLGRRRY